MVIKKSVIKLSDKILLKIIQEYTRESGVRELDRMLAAVMRYTAKQIALEEEVAKNVTAEHIEKILGKPRYNNEIYTKGHPPGVVVGLAWTAAGGDILFIETSISKGKGGLTLTGNLGDVMKESATTALSYLKAHAQEYGIASELFEETHVHVHVPEGAVPKDGPSAGITMLTALTSAFTKRKVKPYLAMSGEITLRGEVLPVGGIKEKTLAAKRAGIKNIILCKQNQKDVDEIPQNYIAGITFHFIEEANEVLSNALE
ncbi:MAG: hypothetical protein EBX41_07445 [Chitinophagia bacterium]|nr:hypothetical protein [Chitinophagia bacterium]